MVMDLKSLFVTEGEKINLSHSLDLSDVEVSGGFPLKSPVKVEALLQNRAGIVTFVGKAFLSFDAPCDRCTADTISELTVPVSHTLLTSVNNEETEDMIIIPDMQLDVDELLRCDVILGLPVKHLCSEDCEGLCPQCGKNLNFGKCDCKHPVDPRLEGLRQLME